jgi:tRNA-dihydrouridine synthase A
MMERTDRHFRYLMRLIAPSARVYTEMITTGALLCGDADGLLRYDRSEHPVALQLGGSEPDALARAAVLGEQAGYDEINLNVGCPSGRVQRGAFGAALMLDATQVARCVAAMRSAVSLPVTVKTRLGVDEHDDFDFLARFVDRVAGVGCETFVIHARKAWLRGLSPRQNREVPPLDYERVYHLKSRFPELEIVLNGGLSADSPCEEMLERVDGLMLGRAAYSDPMSIGALDAVLFPSRSARRGCAQVLEAYLDYVEAELDRGAPLSAMTRHLMGLRRGARGARGWRRSLGALPKGDEGFARLRALVGTFLGACEPRAA